MAFDSSLAPEFDVTPVAIVGGDVADPQAYLNADLRAGVGVNGKDSFTIDEAASQLVRGEPGWSAALGVPFSVTYAFRSSEPTRMPDDAGGFERFNAAQINQAELAMKGWSDAANITFTRVGSGVGGEAAYSNNAAILLGNYTSGVAGAAAFAMYPGDTRASSSSGDVWINSSIGYNAAPTVGNYGGMVLVHEIGHAIGLAHPADYDAEEGVTLTYDANATYYEDSRQYTVMSYFSETNTGANFGTSSATRYSAAPLLDDIAAVQLEYGANMTTRTGDTVYGFNSNAERPWFIASSASQKMIFAVWDAGGKDTFDFSGFSNNQVIELRQGFFSNVGGLTGNVAVAQGAVIENARGGFGADRITGNSADNGLWGGGGNDTIDGGLGGKDFIRGDDGDDSLAGGAEFDDINGNMGADTASGGPGDDWVVGGKDNDLLFGDDGADVVLGNIGADILYGGAGNDVMRGGQDNDVLRGEAGADWLSGDRGADTLVGGAGADTFHTFGDAGLDRVLDFSQAEGDRVQLDPGTVYNVHQVGLDTVIDMTGGGQMILEGVQLASLTSGWLFTL